MDTAVGNQRVIRLTTVSERVQAPVESTPFHKYVLGDGTLWTEFYRSDAGYLLRFPDLADFEVSADGTEVIAHPAQGTNSATVEHLYLNQIAPLALSRQGQPAFHASVVTLCGGAVAFLGKSGMGKSTLAASFAFAGAAFLTDDSLVIEERDGGCFALSSHPSLRLWQDSVDALIGSEVVDSTQVSYSSKARLLAGQTLTHSKDPVSVHAAFVLGEEEPEDIAIERLSGNERHMSWVMNSFLLDIEDRELLAEHFDWTHRISGKVPTFSLGYARKYSVLPQVRETVIDHVRSLTN